MLGARFTRGAALPTADRQTFVVCHLRQAAPWALLPACQV